MTPKKILAKLQALTYIARPHHWIKNVFVILPAFFGGQLHDKPIWGMEIAAFFVFSFVASAVYIFNDIRDYEADRRHSKKNRRPLSSGKLEGTDAWLLLGGFLLAAVALLSLAHLPTTFIGVILIYLSINILYSMGFKHVAVLELFLLASGYMLRLIAGSEITHTPMSGWMIVTTGLLAFLMAAGKRRGDLAQANDKDRLRKSLNGYSLLYLDQIIAMLGSATMVTYLLFCISDYATARFGPHIIWSAIFVLYGVLRYMQILTVENSGEEATTVIYRDKKMVITVGLFTLFFALTIYL